MKSIGIYSFRADTLHTFSYGALKIHHDTTCRSYAIEISSSRLNLKFPECGGLSREQVDIALDLLSELLRALGYAEASTDVFQGTSRFNIEYPRARPIASSRRFSKN